MTVDHGIKAHWSHPDRFIDAAFSHGPRVNHSSDWRRKDYLERVVIGGFPEAVRRTPRRRAAFFDAARLGEPGGAAGPMMENFVVMELARQLTWAEERGTLYHYRTKDGVEVDAVIETPDGRTIGVEVKAGATVRTEDLTGLRSLANALGSRFVAGYVLYTGQQTLPFGDKIRAVPLDALWRLSP